MYKNILVTGVDSGLGKFIHNKLDCVGLNKNNKDSIINSNQKFDTIIHCAFSESKTKEVDYYNQYKNNILFTDKLLNLNHKRFFYLSSILVKSKSDSLYKHTKLYCESVVTKKANNPTILRCSSIIGSDMKMNNTLKMLREKNPQLSLSADSNLSYITHTDIFNFIKFCIDNKINGTYDFVASDYITLGELSSKLNKKVKFGNFTYLTPISNNRELVKLLPSLDKTSYQNIINFLKTNKTIKDEHNEF